MTMPYLHLNETETGDLLEAVATLKNQAHALGQDAKLAGLQTLEEKLAAHLSPPAEDAERHAKIRALAKSRGYKVEPEIDDDAIVSEGDDNGAYVHGWFWVDFEGTDLADEGAGDEGAG